MKKNKSEIKTQSAAKPRKAREGWAIAFKKMHRWGDDNLVDKELNTKWEKTKWHW